MIAFWINSREGSSKSSLALTQESLKELGQIWQFLPRVKIGDKVFQGQAIATIQTTTRLQSLVTPIAGTIMNIATETIERPELIDSQKALFYIKEHDEMFRL